MAPQAPVSSRRDQTTAARSGGRRPRDRACRPLRRRPVRAGARGAPRPVWVAPALPGGHRRAGGLPRGARSAPRRRVEGGRRGRGRERHLLRARGLRLDADPPRDRSGAAARQAEALHGLLRRHRRPRVLEQGRALHGPRSRRRAARAASRRAARTPARATVRRGPGAHAGRLARTRGRAGRDRDAPARPRERTAPRRQPHAPLAPRRHPVPSRLRRRRPVHRGHRRGPVSARPEPHAAQARGAARQGRRRGGGPAHGLRRHRGGGARSRRRPRGGARPRRPGGDRASGRPRGRQLRRPAGRTRHARRARAGGGGRSTPPLRRGSDGVTPPPVLAGVAALLEAALSERIAPALGAAVLRGGAPIHLSSHGEIPAPAPRPLLAGDLFDVASLTKVMATTSVAVQLVAEGLLDVDAPAALWLAGFDRGERARITVRHLLTHSSGLPGWRPFYERAMADAVAGRAFLPPGERPPLAALGAAFARGEAILREAILSEPLEAPPGLRAVYSDLGFLALGWVLEAAGGDRLCRLARRRVFEPLGLRRTRLVDWQDPLEAAAFVQ